ncbi:hypothetical protein HYPSUDRAFT_120156, partial [Hypholoma sublateritium FD-334 SS-4]
GKYSVEIGSNMFEFYNAELAPPAGIAGKNYSWAIHHEAHPHRYSVSWTISRSPDTPDRCHFFLARYGFCIHQAPNTLIVWIPSEAHRTSLPDACP